MKNLIKLLSMAALLALVAGQVRGQFVWTKDGLNPVMSGGGTGSWNESPAVPWVIFNPDSNRYEMWYTGSFTGGIGFAVSTDGTTWKSDPNPVLTPTAHTWDSLGSIAGCVIRDNGTLKMWYTGVNGPFPGGLGVGAIEIGYATSTDGRHWTKYPGNPVLSAGSDTWDAGSVGFCSVIKVPGGYQMFYTGHSVTGLAVICRATSVDGIAWQRDTVNNPVLDVAPPGGWDRNIYLPAVVVSDGKYFLWYTAEATPGGGQGAIGLASSTDSGKTWTRYGSDPVLTRGPSGSWDQSYVELGSVVKVGGTLHLWYDGSDSPTHVTRIGHATSPFPGMRRRVPQDYATIQGAIDSSSDGDTVLVSEGIYKENIRYRSKAIVVASLYAVDKDTTHIAKTIIDGSNPAHPDSGSVVSFIDGEDSTSVLCGLTIRGGSGTFVPVVGSGWGRVGGGIYCELAGARLVRNVITRNRVIGRTAQGGGVAAENDTLPMRYVILEGNSITDNFVQGDSSGRWGYSGGADFTNTSVRIVGNLFERDTVIAANYAVGGGIGLGGSFASGPFPTVYIQGNIFRANVADAKLPGGTGGGIGGAIYLGWTVQTTVADNTFEGNVARGSGSWGNGGALVLDNGGAFGIGRAAVLRNRFFKNYAQSQVALAQGGAISLLSAQATLNGNYLAENSAVGGGAGYGGGIYTDYSGFRLENNIITRNYANESGGGVSVWMSPPQGNDQLIINNTIVDNNATYSGGGLSISGMGFAVVLNNIFWADSALQGPEIFGPADVNYCDVQGWWPVGTGNLNAPPMFVTADTMFNLTPTSPCIGRGIKSMQIGSVWYDSPAFDFDGQMRPRPSGTQRPDIGAQEEQLTLPPPEGWIAQSSGTNNALFRVCFTDISVGTVVGDLGTILRTTDAGTTWASQASGSTNSLYGVALWRSQNGWVAGAKGTLLHTTNGGSAWSPQASGKTVDLWDIACTDSTTATAVGGLGTIIRTTNGGGVWSPQSSGTARRLMAICFSDPNTATVVGDTGTIVRTTDGGATWNPQTSGTTNNLYEVSFTDVNNGFAVGASGTILRTTNAGATWTPQTSGTTKAIWDVAFTTTNLGTVVGEAGIILQSGDGGATWKSQLSGTTHLLYAVAFPDPNNGTAVGENGVILHTTTGGIVVGVREDPILVSSKPSEYALFQNYPNPFNPTTTIRYGLPQRSYVTLTVFNTLGQQVATLVQGEQEAGLHEVRFDAVNLSSGVYLCRLQAGDFSQVRKLLLVK